MPQVRWCRIDAAENSDLAADRREVARPTRKLQPLRLEVSVALATMATLIHETP